VIGWLIFLAAPLAMGAALRAMTPPARRPSLEALGLYAALVTAIVAGALAFVAGVAGASVPPLEVAIAAWFTFTLRLAFELWRRLLQWVAPTKRVAPTSPPVSSSPGMAPASPPVSSSLSGVAPASPPVSSEGVAPAPPPVSSSPGVAPASPPVSPRPLAALFIRRVAPPLLRTALTLLIFIPAALSFVLTHRFKLHDGTDPRTLLAAEFEQVRIPTADGIELDAWFVPQTGADRTIVICHGAGANKGNFIWYLPPLLGRGWNLVLFDLRAHGESGGRIGTYGLHERRDVRAVVDWLERERPEAARRIVGIGSSQGAMALALAAADDPRIEALVLDSPYTSPRALAHHHLGRLGAPGRLFADLVLWKMSLWTGADFLHASALDAVRRRGRRPLLVIYGEDDVIMPRSHAQALFDAATGPKALWIGPGPHSNIVTTVPEEYAERVFRLLTAR